MKTRKEWVIMGRFRKDDQFHCVVNGSISITKFKSIEEVRERLKIMQAEEEAAIASKKRPGYYAGSVGVDTPYYSDYDIVEWQIREREVTLWYNVE